MTANSPVKVEYFTSVSGKNYFNDFLDSIQPSQQSKILRVLSHLSIYGLQQIIPHIKKLTGTPFWEIRILGKDNIRTIFIPLTNSHIIVLHGFIKKSQKAPKGEINTAYLRYQEWLKYHS